jgi:hypothetical protein
VTEVDIVREMPPEVWLRDCTEYLPALPIIKTNGDLALVIAPLVQALEQCTEDKRALRQWAQEPTQ